MLLILYGVEDGGNRGVSLKLHGSLGIAMLAFEGFKSCLKILH